MRFNTDIHAQMKLIWRIIALIEERSAKLNADDAIRLEIIAYQIHDLYNAIEECYIILNALRGFRHFFRHAYGVPIDYAQLTVNLEKVRQLRSPLEQDISQFLQRLESD